MFNVSDATVVKCHGFVVHKNFKELPHAIESIRSTDMDTHYQGSIFAYCGGYALLWWVIMLDVVGYYA